MKARAARIGIDVGGTNTDAVVMCGRDVIGWVKRPTTPDVTAGVIAALEGVLAKTGVRRKSVSTVMIGTTHFTNAVVQRRDLARVAVFRLCGTATHSLPPMVDWPDDLRAAVAAYTVLLPGGAEFDGRPITPFDDRALSDACREARARGIVSVAVSGVFAPVESSQERRALEIIEDEMPGVAVTLSHEVGRLGLLQRENAAILNACLRPLGATTIGAFREALARLRLKCPLYLSQNDGTLMSAEFAERFPVHTFASGPTNSMRGAAFLSGLRDAIVIDIGGTTTDVGALANGFPREAAVEIEVGGVLTNFRMPDVISFGLGGGSLVEVDNGVSVGPLSVGYELTRKALVFGGDTLTATDLAVAAGRTGRRTKRGQTVGDAALVRDLEPAIAANGVATIDRMIADAVDRTKLSRDPVPVVLVGGGSILAANAIEGAATVIRPRHFEVANAVGAAISQISGEVDHIAALADVKRDDALDAAKREASDRAVAAGADRDSIEIVEVDEVPLAYVPSNATRIRVKAVGNLRVGSRSRGKGKRA